jgi:hypothetical protein
MQLITELFPRYGHSAVLSVRYLAFSGMRQMKARSEDWEKDESYASIHPWMNPFSNNNLVL